MQKQKVIFYFEGNADVFPGIKVTLKSLKEVYSGEIVVLVNKVSDNLKNFLTEEKIEVLDCGSYPVTFKTSAYNNKVIYTFLYLKQQKEILKNYQIIICDIGDFYFKQNPFELFSNNELSLSIETQPIKNCEVNKTWLNICFGEQITNEIENNIVINAGFIKGSFEEVYNLYNKITIEMSKILGRINYPITDQAIVNKLIYKDNLNAMLSDNIINNFSQSKKIDGKPIVHQYKVNSEITSKLYSIYE